MTNIILKEGERIDQLFSTDVKIIQNKDGTFIEKTVANRRAFLEFTLSRPKEISVVALLGTDNRMINCVCSKFKNLILYKII